MGSKGAKSSVDYDHILRYLGQCGRWQWINFFLLWLTSAAGGLAVVVWAFTAYTQESRCPISYCDNMDQLQDNQISGPDYVKKDYVGTCAYPSPLPNVSSSVLTCPDYTSLTPYDLTDKYCTYDQLIIDTSIVETSLLTDFGLNCKRANVSVLGASYMLGMLIGSFVMGLISDHFGRMKALMISVVCVSLSGFIGAWVTEPISFGFLRFFTGIGGIGCFMVTFVLAVEYVGARYTMLFGIAIEIPFAIGELILGLEAYFIRDWRTLQLVAYTPLIVLLVLWFLIPESPRWLLAAGREEEAVKIIRKAAKVNNRVIPEHVLEGKNDKENEFSVSEDSEERQPNLFDLFRPKSIAFRSFNMFYQWFSVTMCYYGLSFASTSLSGDAYTNFLLSVVVEIPGYIFCIVVMDCWGRRPILSFAQALSGVACIAAGLLAGNEALSALQIILSLVGKFGASACFAIVYVYTAELFPTIIRNTAIGSCSTVARVGGIFALLIQELRIVWGPLPMLIMGVTAVVAGCLAILFPETVGKPLPETMDEAINIENEANRGLCTCICPGSIKQWFHEEDEIIIRKEENGGKE